MQPSRRKKGNKKKTGIDSKGTIGPFGLTTHLHEPGNFAYYFTLSGFLQNLSNFQVGESAMFWNNLSGSGLICMCTFSSV